MENVNVILSPIISEKSMSDASKGKYSFRVHNKSTKKDIKKAVEEKFKVNVIKTATIFTKKRKTRMGTKKAQTLNKFYKKAIVTLKEGQKISIFDSGANQ